MSAARRSRDQHRLDRSSGPSVRNWQPVSERNKKKMKLNTAVDLGWGRLIFGHTYTSNEALAEEILAEQPGHRDIALYLRDPHVVVSLRPDRLFLDPSHTYRLWSNRYRPGTRHLSNTIIRRVKTRHDAEEANRIYATHGMVTSNVDFMLDHNAAKLRCYFVAEQTDDKQVVGVIQGLDHVEAFNDPENGASFWCLAVDPQSDTPGVGEALVRHVCEYHFARGREYVDLSVMHDNTGAIRLYEKLGFERIPAFCVKRKNPINEKYFMAPAPEENLNPYAKIIVDEARRRGIRVVVDDAATGFFTLHFGGREVSCRESLSDHTSAVAMSRCDDKRVTRRLLERAGVRVPAQTEASSNDDNLGFLEKHERLVVKPARGEQGRGISVDVREPVHLEEAIKAASEQCETVILEQFVQGDDLRVIVINREVVAAAVRRPPILTGMDSKTIRELLESYNRRRMAATGGESKVPIDGETLRCIRDGGYEIDDVLPVGEKIRVRKTANLHTGGTIHDVTEQLHDELGRASIEAADALDMPVVGLDLLVPAVDQPEYVMIEANERPGLANHEPQPTAERFIDFLFPQTVQRDQ